MTHRVILSKGVHTSSEAKYEGNKEISISETEYKDFKNAGVIVKDLGGATSPKELEKENELLKAKIALLEKKSEQVNEVNVRKDSQDGLPTNYMQLKKLAVDKGYTGEDMKADALKAYLKNL